MHLFICYFILKAVRVISTQMKHRMIGWKESRIQFRFFRLCWCVFVYVYICVCIYVRPLHSNNLSLDSLTKKFFLSKSPVFFVLFCFVFVFMCAPSCFYLLDLWHSDNEQARSVIGTAAVCPVEMHTSRLETVSLCLTMLHHLCVCVWLCLGCLSSLACSHTHAHTQTHTYTRLLACKCKADNLTVVLGVWKAAYKSVCKKNKDAPLIQV